MNFFGSFRAGSGDGRTAQSFHACTPSRLQRRYVVAISSNLADHLPSRSRRRAGGRRSGLTGLHGWFLSADFAQVAQSAWLELAWLEANPVGSSYENPTVFTSRCGSAYL